ncbi:phosphatidylserine decarboxylase proenzyme 2 [Cucumis melo var. makuwa]|uniref:Phosphatidylserine decarboxylase proenzyme 2 n=1 Tax=Cucumis melo var. makuwa TaxID=1194695 RepID=A0A5D3CUB3_CUCMM|nr:phosphatidylserine decarboxylase proenzyme 2 [Cucumis melo var. makuwa]
MGGCLKRQLTGRLVEETIDGKIVLSTMAIYQSKGLTLVDKEVKELLDSISEKQGKRMD